MTSTCDVAVIWSVLWQGRMAGNKKVWDDFRSQGKPVVVVRSWGTAEKHHLEDGHQWY
jgi:hypothetical protein